MKKRVGRPKTSEKVEKNYSVISRVEMLFQTKDFKIKWRVWENCGWEYCIEIVDEDDCEWQIKEEDELKTRDEAVNKMIDYVSKNFILLEVEKWTD